MDQTSEHFVPKQALPTDAEHLCEICYPTTSEVARHFLTLIAQFPFTDKSTVHDNGCAYGEVSREILETRPPSGVKLHGTDNNENMVKAYRRLSSSFPQYNIESSLMPAEALTFPDNHFTHSFTNFLILSGPNPEQNVPIAKEIYRTLKPGGVAVITDWAAFSHKSALQAAHHATRGPDASPLAFSMGDGFLEPSYLSGVIAEAGFEPSKIQVASFEVAKTIPVDMKPYSALLWSFLGSTVEGWKESDEKNWDRAIEVMAATLPRSCRALPDGSYRIELTATIVIAAK